MHVLPKIFSYLAFVGSSLAITVYYPDCAVPLLQLPYYVDSANVRGTLDIVWSCVFTILICTWSAQHLNVPAQRNLQGPISGKEFMTSMLRGFWTKLKWMMATLILPEFLVGRAVQDWVLAWRMSNDKTLKEMAVRDGKEWTIVHAFYANMGGFVVKVTEKEIVPTKVVPIQTEGPSPGNIEEDNPWAIHSHPMDASLEKNSFQSDKAQAGPHRIGRELTFSHELEDQIVSAEMRQGLQTSHAKGDYENLREQFFHANARQIYVLRCMGLIDRMPSISRHEIEAKSKGDVLVKATALFQVLWLLMSVIARGAQQLPISQLEIASIAFAACAFLTYGFSWYKPQDVQEAVVIGSVDSLTSRQLELLRNAAGHSLFWHMVEFMLRENRSEVKATFAPIPNDVTYRELEFRLDIGSEGYIYYNFVGTGIMLASLVFGAIHCAAWNFDFPTPVETTLWRVASLVSTCVLIVHPLAQTAQAFVLLHMPFLEQATFVRRTIAFGFNSLTFFAMFSYVVARLFLMVEMFRCLFYLPYSAFLSSWPSIIPHIG